MRVYVLDACALIAFFTDENGAEKVEEILRAAEAGSCQVFINKINLLEVYYDLWRKAGLPFADKALKLAYNQPLMVVDVVSDSVFKEAANFKVQYRLSLADAIALAETKTRKGHLVTCDHHEMDEIEKKENLDFLWIR